MRACTVDGCPKPHRAKGLCARHYNAQTASHHPKRERHCETCGTSYLTARPDGRFCSLACRDWARADRVLSSPVPDSHPSRSTPVPTDHPSRAPLIGYAEAWPVWYGDCADCGACFSSNTPVKTLCSLRCSKRASRRRRRAREHGQGDSFAWTEVMKLFLAFGRCCAYCRQPITGQPDPDHVVPLSRGGHNTISNILPACRICNADKNDHTLSEWPAERARLGRPAVITTWDVSDPRYHHLALRPAQPRRLPRPTRHAA